MRFNGRLFFRYLSYETEVTLSMILFSGTETETKAFMAICVETLKRFVDFTVFILGKCYRILKTTLYHCATHVG